MNVLELDAPNNHPSSHWMPFFILNIILITQTETLSHESTDAFLSIAFNYTTKEGLIYPLKEKLLK